MVIEIIPISRTEVRIKSYFKGFAIKFVKDYFKDFKYESALCNSSPIKRGVYIFRKYI